MHEDNRIPDLIAKAYAHKNAAQYMIVKGKTDYLANREGIQATIEQPSVEVLEAIGETGDTLTGIAAALIAAGRQVTEAAEMAAKINRLAGFYANPNPGTPVRKIIECVPRALEEIIMITEEAGNVF